MHLIEGEGMRTTLNIEDELLAKAAELTGIKIKTSLVKLRSNSFDSQGKRQETRRLGGNRKETGCDPPPKNKRVIT